MVKVNLTNNAGFKWYQKNDYWVKGAICNQAGNSIDLNIVVGK